MAGGCGESVSGQEGQNKERGSPWVVVVEAKASPAKSYPPCCKSDIRFLKSVYAS